MLLARVVGFAVLEHHLTCTGTGKFLLRSLLGVLEHGLICGVLQYKVLCSNTVLSMSCCSTARTVPIAWKKTAWNSNQDVALNREFRYLSPCDADGLTALCVTVSNSSCVKLVPN